MAPPIDLRVVGDRIEELLEQLETSLEDRAWTQVQDVVSLVTELYGGGLTGELLLPYDVGPTGEELEDDSVTGQTVVEIGMVFVTTVVECAGQLVTEAAQEVIVYSVVEYTVPRPFDMRHFRLPPVTGATARG